MHSNSKLKIYVIVGEESGENIASTLISSLQKHVSFELYGIGGTKLNQKGLNSLFPYTELSIMGLVEIIPKIPKILYLINKTVKHILHTNPDLIITVGHDDIEKPPFVMKENDNKYEFFKGQININK